MFERSLIVVGVVAILGAGCAETVSVQVLRPAEINLRGIKKIAIGDLAGAGGDVLGGELTTALFNSGRYEVLDRQNLDKVLAEQQLTASSIADPATAVQVGKILGASAAVFGTVSRHAYGEQFRKEPYEVVTGKGMREAWVRYRRIGVAKVSVTFRVTDLTTGKIIAARTIAKEAVVEQKREVPYGTRDDEATPEPIDGEEVLAAARGGVIEQFMKAVAPFYETLSLPFQTSGELPELAEGVNAARGGDWRGAVASFERAVRHAGSLDPKKQSYAYLDYGMALCFGIADLEGGLSALHKAHGLNPTTDSARVGEMCKTRQRDAARLEAQGITEESADGGEVQP